MVATIAESSRSKNKQISMVYRNGRVLLARHGKSSASFITELRYRTNVPQSVAKTLLLTRLREGPGSLRKRFENSKEKGRES